MVLSKAQVETLIAHAMTSGYGEAYNRLSVNVQALPYIPAFKEELLQSIQNDRPIDVSKFEKSKTTEKPVGEDGSGSTKNKRPWFSQNLRKPK